MTDEAADADGIIRVTNNCCHLVKISHLKNDVVYSSENNNKNNDSDNNNKRSSSSRS